MGVTIKDVAKRAGVSHTTVSMVVHDDKRITSETKAKVQIAIKELNYHPNYLARGLVRGKSNSIAVVATMISNMFENAFLKGLESSVEDPSYNVNNYSTRNREDAKNQILNNILYGKMADAVIALGVRPDEEIAKAFIANEIPIIIIEDIIPGIHSFTVNNYSGALAATQHMIERGKKNIGIIVGSGKGDEQGLSPKERLDGYKEALKNNGIAFKEENVHYVESFSFDDGVEGAKKFIASPEKIDGIFCASGDVSAMGAIRQLKENNISIPGEVAVVGFDDIEFAELVSPALTTVRQPLAFMGMEAYKLAIDAAKGKVKETQNRVFDTELIIRETT